MDLHGKLSELVEQEFEEVEDEPYVMFELGRKYSKRLGFKQAVASFEERFNKSQPMWYVQQDSQFFSERLGASITKDKFLIQENEIIESSREDAIGTNILVRKHLTKKSSNKFVHAQSHINMIDLDPHTYAQESIDDTKKENLKEKPYEDILNLFNEKSQSRRQRRKKPPNKQF